MAVNRRILISVLAADVFLFVMSNVTIKSDSHPGTASDVLWVVFLLGVLLLIVLGVVALLQSRRSRAS